MTFQEARAFVRSKLHFLTGNLTCWRNLTSWRILALTGWRTRFQDHIRRTRHDLSQILFSLDADATASPYFLWPCVALGTYVPHLYIYDAVFYSDDVGRRQVLEAALLLSPLLFQCLDGFALLERNYIPCDQREVSDSGQKGLIRPDDTFHQSRDVPDRLLQTNPDKGLTDSEVRERRAEWGSNVPVSTRDWTLFFRLAFVNPTHWCAIGVIIHAALTLQWHHVLLGVLHLLSSARQDAGSFHYLNGLIKERAWDPTARALVVRSGAIEEVSASDLVPGDIVHLSAGLQVPADCLIISSRAILGVKGIPGTGEEGRVRELGTLECCEILYEVTRGDAFAVVLNTGARTNHGRYAVRWARPPHLSTGYLRELKATGSFILLTATTLRVAAALLGSEQRPWQAQQKLVVSLATAIALFRPHNGYDTNAAQSGGKMAERQMIDTTSSGRMVELLASVDTLCVDDLGTVTENSRRILDPLCFDSTAEELVSAAALTRCWNRHKQSSTDIALSTLLRQWPKARARARAYKVIRWDIDHVMDNSGSLIENDTGRQCHYIRATCQALAKKLRQEGTQSAEACEWLETTDREQAQRGLNTLAVAKKHPGEEWSLLGAFPVSDRPRLDSKAAAKISKDYGFSIKVFSTGPKAALNKVAQLFDYDLARCTTAHSLLSLPSKESDHFGAADIISDCTSAEQTALILAAQSRHGHRIAATVANPRALEHVTCGIAPFPGHDRLNASAHALKTTNMNLCVFASNIAFARGRFQWMVNRVITRSCEILILVVVVLGAYAVKGTVLDLRVWIIGVLGLAVILSLTMMSFGWPAEEVMVLCKPLQWGDLSTVREGLPMLLVASLGGVLLWHALPTTTGSSPEAWLAIRSQTFSIYLLTVQHAVAVLVKTGPQWWKRKYARRYLAGYLGWSACLTVVCAGTHLGADTPLSLRACGALWSVNAVVLLTLWAVRSRETSGRKWAFLEDMGSS